MNVRLSILLLAILLGFGGNVWAESEMHGSHHGDEEAKHEHAGDEKSHDHTEATGEKMVYSCPMHPEVKQDQPGKCPKCGMNLEKVGAKEEAAQETKEEMKKETQEHAGHDMHGMSGHKH